MTTSDEPMAPAYKRKLIEVALPLEDINREAAREKSIRPGPQGRGKVAHAV